jgi:alpha-galactosidase
MTLNEVWDGHNDSMDYSDFDYTKDGAQQWHDSILVL